MFAVKFAKGLGLASLGAVGIFLMILIAVVFWIVGGFIAALIPAWIIMLVAGGVFHTHWAYTSVWLITALVMMLFGA